MRFLILAGVNFIVAVGLVFLKDSSFNSKWLLLWEAMLAGALLMAGLAH